MAVLASPSAVFRELLDCLDTEDWSGAVLLHAQSFVEFYVARVLRSVHPPRRRPTVESLLRDDPGMPREVASYEVERAERAPPHSPYFGDIYGVESEAELGALSGPDVFARYLHGRDYRWRWRLYLDRLMDRHPQHRDELAVQRSSVRSPWDGDVVGHVEHDAKAYVLYGVQRRPESEYDEDLAPSVAVMRRTDQGWRVSSDIVPSYATAFGPARVSDGAGGWVVLS